MVALKKSIWVKSKFTIKSDCFLRHQAKGWNLTSFSFYEECFQHPRQRNRFELFKKRRCFLLLLSRKVNPPEFKSSVGDLQQAVL